METEGVLRMELVDHVFSKFCRQGLIREDILKMMEQFGLIVSFTTSPTDVQYFVPAQLKTPPGSLCEMEPSPSDPCVLYLHFLGGFVTHGLFLQLVSQCSRWCSMNGFKQPPFFFDGASIFFIEKECIHQLILVCKKRFIKIVLKQSKPNHKLPVAEAEVETERVASLVRGFLEDTLQNLSCELSWFSNLKYDWRVACPRCLEKEDLCVNHGKVSCIHEECLCLLKILSGVQLENCIKCFCGEVPTLPTLKKWFAIKGEVKLGLKSGRMSFQLRPLCKIFQSQE